MEKEKEKKNCFTKKKQLFNDKFKYLRLYKNRFLANFFQAFKKFIQDKKII